jgi:hypothetical protein
LFFPYHVRKLQAAGAAAAGSVPTATITTTKNGTFISTWRGTNGAKLTFDWGDGSAPSEITLLGTGVNVAANHPYSSGVEKTIVVTGELDSVSLFSSGQSNLTMVGLKNLKYTTRVECYLCSNLVSGNTYPSSLTYIDLGYTGIENLNELQNLVNLESLRLYNCTSFYDLSGLSTFSNLETLHLKDTAITDISSVAAMSSQVTDIWLYNCSINYVGYTWSTRTSGTFRFDSTVSTSGEVDQWLIDLATANWSDTITYLDGTNPARTSASDDAVAQLVLDGNVLHLS